MPPLVVDYSQLWIEAELRGSGNGQDWARRSAAELMSRRHWANYRTRRGEKRLAALLEQAAVISRKRQDAAMGFILIPSAKDGLKGMAAFCPVDLAGRRGDEAWDGLLALLAPDTAGDSQTEITEMESKAGPCRRVRLRYATASGPEPGLREHVAYIWVFEAYGAAVIMTMTFLDMTQAARWLPALDELAHDVWLQQ
jgi:hypothetical protein